MPAAYHRTSEERTVVLVCGRSGRRAGSAADEDDICFALVKRQYAGWLVAVLVDD